MPAPSSPAARAPPRTRSRRSSPPGFRRRLAGQPRQYHGQGNGGMRIPRVLGRRRIDRGRAVEPVQIRDGEPVHPAGQSANAEAVVPSSIGASSTRTGRRRPGRASSPTWTARTPRWLRRRNGSDFPRSGGDGAGRAWPAPTASPATGHQRRTSAHATLDSIRALMLIRAYRVRGHLEAHLDPLGLKRQAPSRSSTPRPTASPKPTWTGRSSSTTLGSRDRDPAPDHDGVREPIAAPSASSSCTSRTRPRRPGSRSASRRSKPHRIHRDRTKRAILRPPDRGRGPSRTSSTRSTPAPSASAWTAASRPDAGARADPASAAASSASRRW